MTTASPPLPDACGLSFPFCLYPSLVCFIYLFLFSPGREMWCWRGNICFYQRQKHKPDIGTLTQMPYWAAVTGPTVLLVIHTLLSLLCSINLAQSRPLWTVIITLIKKKLWAVCIKCPTCLKLSVLPTALARHKFCPLLFPVVYSTVVRAQIPSSSQRKH